MTEAVATQTEIRRSTEIAAPPSRVWSALTDHREFGTWFLVALDGPFRVGERVTGKMTHPKAVGMPFEATVVAMEPPRHFAFTWPQIDMEDHSRIDSAETTVTFELEEIATGTRLTVRESGFEALPADRRDAAFRMNDGGWQFQMGNIKAHVEGGS